MLILHRTLGAAAAAAALWLSAAPVGAEGVAASEYALKAAIIYKLTKFVSWPDAAFSGPASPLSICLDSNSAYLPAMKALEGRSAQGHIVEIHPLVSGENVESHCHVLFVSVAEKGQVAGGPQAATDAPVLTIGEGDEFVEKGGIIGLRVEENRITFIVNVAAGTHARLAISARLLQLATIFSPGEA